MSDDQPDQPGPSRQTDVYMLGLALDGANGVEAVTANLLADFDLTMGLTGCASLSDVDECFVVES